MKSKRYTKIKIVNKVTSNVLLPSLTYDSVRNKFVNMNINTEIFKIDNIDSGNYKVEWSLNLTNTQSGNFPTMIYLISDVETIEDSFVDMDGTDNYSVKSGFSIIPINSSISLNILSQYSNVMIKKCDIMLTKLL